VIEGKGEERMMLVGRGVEGVQEGDETTAQ
jgi:hypothetical protein